MLIKILLIPENQAACVSILNGMSVQTSERQHNILSGVPIHSQWHANSTKIIQS